MNDMIEAYVTGKQEGYFNTRLDYSILDGDQKCRMLFMSGYKSGKLQRQKEIGNGDEVSNRTYNQIRKTYITVMGYKASFENYTVDSALLKGKDGEAFDEGYQIGLLCKLGKISEIRGEDLETYIMITGHEINEESYLVYLDMLKSKSAGLFQRGHEVKKICANIRKSAINELNDKQLDMFMNRKKR